MIVCHEAVLARQAGVEMVSARNGEQQQHARPSALGQYPKDPMGIKLPGS